MKRTYRCSSIPRIMTCASSAGEADAPVNTPSDESDIGTAAHDCLASVVMGDEPDVSLAAKQHGVDEEELGFLVAAGRRIWDKVKKYLPNPKAEQRIDDELTPGTADVLHADGETLVVVDWKSGRSKRAYQDQLCGYANIARKRHGMPRSGVVTTAIGWLRDGDFDVEEWTAAELDAWEKRFLAQVERVGEQYAPTGHCEFCPLKQECAAYRGYMQTAASTMLETSKTYDITPERLGELYPMSRMLKSALDQYEKAVKLAIATHGPLAIGDGSMIGLVEQQRVELDAKLAWPMLVEAGLTDDDINGALTLGKGAIEKAIKAKAPRGEKERAAAELMGRLKSSGAAVVTMQSRLETKKGAA